MSGGSLAELLATMAAVALARAITDNAGPVQTGVTRDRAGSVKPVTVKKHQRGSRP